MGKHPSTSSLLEVDELGQGEYRHDEGNGDPLLGGVGGSFVCRKRVPPALHRKLVESGRSVVASGACTKGPTKRGMPSTSIRGSFAGAAFGCSVNRDAPSYQAFHSVREQVTDALCR
jgi:hypothetical protein